MSAPLNNFGDLVRSARTARSMSQEELARRAGISRTYLSHIEQGQAKNLSVRLSAALAAELDLEVAEPGIPKDDVPPSLVRYAAAHDLDEDMVASLAAVRYRGQRPQTDDQWRILHQLIRATIGEPKDQ